VRLGSKIYDGVSAGLQSGEHRLAVGYIALYKLMSDFIQSFEVVQIAGISESVEVGDFARGSLLE
jgi:hypothetical protein